MPGPEYTAREGERVWSVLGDFDAPAAENQNTTVVGPVQKGCVIDFATIDDDEDERINYFLLDGAVIYTMGQGLSTRGRFFIPRDGMLSYEANDSIGMFLSVCEKKVTLTPTMTVTPTATLEPTFTPVSYTHLDVYKRQALGRARVPADGAHAGHRPGGSRRAAEDDHFVAGGD